MHIMTFWDQGDSKGPTLKPKNSKWMTFTLRGGFFTFLAILAHSVALPNFGRSVNPILSKGGRLCLPNNNGTPGISDLPTAHQIIWDMIF